MEAGSGVLQGLLSLPEGGGALRGLGDRFQPDLLRGTANYSVPIEVPKGPNGVAPDLSLRYSSGQGNGPFGLGWQLGGVAEIRRRTDRGLPAYDQTDEFVLAGAETLVPVGGGRYRPRADTRFLDIRHTDEGWVVRTKDGRSTVLGATAGSRIEDAERVFAWLAARELDPAGNAIEFEWLHHGGQAYLAEVRWSVWSLRFTYQPRPDVLHDGRARLPITTALRCTRIERRSERLAEPVLARYDLDYAEAEGSALSLLAAIRLTGVAADGTEETAPVLRLSYTSHRRGSSRYHRVRAQGVAPPSLGAEGTALVDLDGDGLPDVLQTDPRGHRWWPNRGDGAFGSVRAMPVAPVGMQVGRRGVSFADLDGDGTADLFRVEGTLGVAVANTASGSWSRRPTVYRRQLPLNLSGSATRLTDLDGDGVADLLQSGPGGLVMTYGRRSEGWSRPEGAARIPDADRWPNLDLGRPGVHLADMDGDGLEDVVFIAPGRIEYWPSLGRGRFGSRVRMRDAPRFDSPRSGARFDANRLFLADLDGDGTTDLVYVDHDHVTWWLNRSGNGWSGRHDVPFTPPPDVRSLQLVDLLGTGTKGLLWSIRDRTREAPGYRFLELMPDKPYLLSSVDNGLGSVTDITYATSTALRLADERAGNPWATYLPFPVQVVRELARRDLVTGRVVSTRFGYERGRYDGVEREFRGFERVTMTTDGDGHTPGTIRETLFFQGQAGPATTLRPARERALERALSGSPTAVRTFEIGPDGGRTLVGSAELTWDARQEFADGDRFVHFPHAVRTEARDYAPGAADRVETAEYEYDAFGNLVRKRRTGRFLGRPDAETLTSEQRLTYTGNEGAWLVGLPASVETRDSEGRLQSRTEHRYDGAPFEGLPLGQATAGILRRTRELALSEDLLPAGYSAEIDPSWGLVRDSGAWFRTTVAYDHDARGNVVAERDGLGVTRTSSYDADGVFPVRSVAQDGQSVEVDFDPRTAQPAEVRSAGGIITRYRYGPLGRLRAQFDTAPDRSIQLTQVFAADHGDFTVDPARPPRIASIRPAAAGRDLAEFEAAVTDDALASLQGVSVAFDHYDGDGNLLQRIGRGPDGPGGEVRWICAHRRDWTLGGRQSADYPNEFVPSPAFHRERPNGQPVRFFYNAAGRATRIEHPDGGRLAVRYGLDRIEKHDAEMADDALPITERYDAWGRLIGVDQPIATSGVATTRYTVDALGRTAEVHDASGRRLIASTFAGPGEAVRIEHADAGHRTYWRDASGRLRLRTDSLGRRLALDYDVHGRLVRVTDLSDPLRPEIVRSVRFEGPRLVAAREGEVTTTFAHDAIGRPIRRTTDAGDGTSLSVERRYGLRGEVTGITYPDGTSVDYTFDGSGSLRAASGIVDDVEYDSHGAPRRIAFSGGPALTYERDAAMRRLLAATLEGPSGVVRRLELGYDHNGNVRSLVDVLPGERIERSFDYDATYRITDATLHREGPSGVEERNSTYDYTATGDLVRNDDSIAGPLTYGDPAHAGRLTEFRPAGAPGPATVSYDDAGRTTQLGGLTSLRYDVWDRLVGVTLADGSLVRFTYDHDGNRIRKEVMRPDGTTADTRYAEHLFELGPDGSRLHVYLGRLLVATLITPAAAPATTAFVLCDHLGTAIAACDAAGNAVHQQVYSPYGLALRSPSDLDRYTGASGDVELGLVRFGARWYSPVLGRFLTPDWFIPENPRRALRLPQGLNAYAYAIGNPLAFRDPSGLWFGMDDLIVAAVGFVVGFVAGTIYGLATGQSLGDSLLRGLEAGILGAVGAWLAWNTAGLALGLLGVSTGGGVGFGIMVGAAVVGGLNGTISGMTRIYDWSSPVGWFAFLSDSSWGLIGTALGDLVHIVNLFDRDRNYRPELSERQNRHVYDGGFGFGTYAFTQGNVTSNLNGRRTDLVDHETLHIWQNRLFGPIFTVTYAAWLAVGFFVALAAAPFTDQDIGQDITDVAYLNNPWESWAYHEGGTGKGGTLAW